MYQCLTTLSGLENVSNNKQLYQKTFSQAQKTTTANTDVNKESFHRQNNVSIARNEMVKSDMWGIPTVKQSACVM